jgi:predicted P-loop ATPase
VSDPWRRGGPHDPRTEEPELTPEEVRKQKYEGLILGDDGMPLRIVENLDRVICRDYAAPGSARVRRNVRAGDECDGEPISDDTITRMRRTLRQRYGAGFDFSPTEVLAHVSEVADRNVYDPVREYLDALPPADTQDWIGALARDYIGDPSPIAADMVRMTLRGAVRRVYEPGCPHPSILVIVGSQGAGKSRLLAALGGPWYRDRPIRIGSGHEGDALLATRGSWIHEVAEFASFQKAGRNSIKEWITITEDEARTAHARLPIRVPRRFVCCATTNDEAFLSDPTGNRRFFPVRVPDGHTIRWRDVEEYRDAIWAQALAEHRIGLPNLFADDAVIEEHNAAYTAEDPYLERIGRYVQLVPVGGCWTVLDMLSQIGVPVSQHSTWTGTRVATILRGLGCEHSRVIIGGRRARYWHRRGEVPFAQFAGDLPGLSSPAPLN